ncbi:tagatose-bisphosphate aldolase, partial [Enterococcus faecalis]
AKKAGCSFNGGLCVRATWADGVLPFVQRGAEAAVAWLVTTGKKNVDELNQVLRESGVSVFEKIQ